MSTKSPKCNVWLILDRYTGWVRGAIVAGNRSTQRIIATFTAMDTRAKPLQRLRWSLQRVFSRLR